MSSKERRRDERESTPDTYTDIHLESRSPDTSKDTNMINVAVKNISVSGICISSTTPLELGQVITFSDPNIAKSGTVVWLFQLKLEYTAGIQFNE